MAPVLKVTGDIVTAAQWNDVAYYNMRALKGLDGTIVLLDGVDIGANELTVNSIEIIGADGEVNAAAIEQHGAATHTNVTRELFIGPDGYLTGGHVNYSSYNTAPLADTVLDALYFTFKVPDDYVSYTSIKLVWVSSGASGNIYWKLKADYAAAGQSYTTHQDNPAYGVTATGGANIINEQAPPNALTMASLALGDYVGVLAARDASDVSDTLNATVYVLGLLFTYIANE